MAYPQAEGPEAEERASSSDEALSSRIMFQSVEAAGGSSNGAPVDVSAKGAAVGPGKGEGGVGVVRGKEPTSSYTPQTLDRLLSLQPASSRVLFTAKSTDLHLQEDSDGEFWELRGPDSVVEGLSGSAPEQVDSNAGSPARTSAQAVSTSEFHDCQEEVLEDSAHIEEADAGALKQSLRPSDPNNFGDNVSDIQVTDNPTYVPTVEQRGSLHSASTSSSESSGIERSCDEEELAMAREVLDDLDSASSAGYTFSKEDMMQLQKESDSLQLLVSQLSSALEEADDQKSQLEAHLQYAVQQQATLPFAVRRGSRMRPTKLGLPAHIEAPYNGQLQQQLGQSRAALVQSINSQNAMRDRVTRLRASGDALRSALAATEAELDIYKMQLELLSGEKGEDVLQGLHDQVKSIESWRRAAKKAVEDTGAASLFRGDFKDGSNWENGASPNSMMETISLKEENENLTRALADLSIRFAEADNEHAQTKRALARAQSQLNLLKLPQDALSPPRVPDL